MSAFGMTRPLRGRLSVFAWAALFVQAVSADLPKYQIKDLGDPPGFSGSWPTAINATGEIVSQAFCESFSECNWRPVVFSGGQVTVLGTFGGPNSYAWDINDLGQVTGSAQVSCCYPDSPVEERAFLFEDGEFLDLSAAVGINSYGMKITNEGVIFGFSVELGDIGFRYEDGVVTTIPHYGLGIRDFNNLGDYLTSSWNPATGTRQALIVSNGTSTFLGQLVPGTYGSLGSDINDHGWVTGHSQVGPAENHAFLYWKDEMVDLGALCDGSGRLGVGIALNSLGDVTGYSILPNSAGACYGEPAAVVSYGGGHMQDLHELVDPRSMSDQGIGQITQGIAINDVGQIAALIRIDNPSGESVWRTGLLTPVDLLLARLSVSVTGVGPGSSLADSVAIARTYYDVDDGPATCGALAGLVNKVEAQAGKKISLEQAEKFIEDATAISEAIGCQ